MRIRDARIYKKVRSRPGSREGVCGMRIQRRLLRSVLQQDCIYLGMDPLCCQSLSVGRPPIVLQIGVGGLRERVTSAAIHRLSPEQLCTLVDDLVGNESSIG